MKVPASFRCIVLYFPNYSERERERERERESKMGTVTRPADFRTINTLHAG